MCKSLYIRYVWFRSTAPEIRYLSWRIRLAHWLTIRDLARCKYHERPYHDPTDDPCSVIASTTVKNRRSGRYKSISPQIHGRGWNVCPTESLRPTNSGEIWHLKSGRVGTNCKISQKSDAMILSADTQYILGIQFHWNLLIDESISFYELSQKMTDKPEPLSMQVWNAIVIIWVDMSSQVRL